MGLSRWLLTKVAGAFGRAPQQRVRHYEVTLFGDALGTFTLPVADHMTDPRALVRPVLTKPFRTEYGDGAFYYWAEPNAKFGGFRTVEWYPPTPEQAAEAERFYRTAHDPALLPPLVARTLEETRLIRAVLANRDAEQPLLDYAAFLTANGDAYGDYIRLSLEVAKLPAGDADRERLDARSEQLADEYGPQWVLPLANIGLFPGVFIPGIDGYYPTYWHGPKGVIEEIHRYGDTSIFPANAARLFHAAPFLRKLSVNQSDATAADFAAVPQLAQIESLSLSVGEGTPDDWRRFAESPHLCGLRELTIARCHFGPEAAGHLSRAAWLANLHTLNLYNDALGDDGAEALATSLHVASLNTLGLGYNDLTDRGLISLCRSPHLARLTTLNVGGGQYTAAGVRAISDAAFAPNLRSIDLAASNLDAEAVRALATGIFPALTALNLSYNAGGDGVRTLVEAAFFRNLQTLLAGGNEAGDGFAETIAAAGFVSLRELWLHGNLLSDAAVVSLVRSEALTMVTKLDLHDNPFGLEGVRALAEADLPLLQDLDLSRVAMGRAGAAALAESRHFTALKRLVVSEEHVGLIGRQTLERRFPNGAVSFW